MSKQKKIDSLSADQWSEMRAFREQQRSLALRIDTIDHDAAKKAVAELYMSAGLTAPRLTIILDSAHQF